MKELKKQVYGLKLEIKYLVMKSFSKDLQMKELKIRVEKARIVNDKLKQE